MKARYASIVSLFLFVLCTTPAVSEAPASAKRTAFDDYIAKPDATYEWKVVKTVEGDGYTTFIVDMKSQTWRSKPEVDRTVWQHWVNIIKPDNVQSDTAFLMIGGGSNGRDAPNGPNALTAQVAKATGSVVAELSMIPNQPLVFNNDGERRVEDNLIAYCWIKFMDTGDPTWLPRFPMVRAAVRAMDTVQTLLASDEGGNTKINDFVVAGGSKRGWTTWMTGVADQRVKAIVPIVIDVLNVDACSVNHYSAYGFWAPAVGDYTRHKIFERRGTEGYKQLLELVDPYSYIDRLQMPKYVVNASGDQFFPPDSSKFYFHDLKGPKYLRYVPNANHSLGGSDALQSIIAFYQSILDDSPLPEYSWKVLADNTIRVETKDEPKEVNLWQATNPKARDFRLETIGRAYKKSTLAPASEGVYIAKVEKPETGWTAFFVELVYDSGKRQPYKFTTQVHIVPDVLPNSINELKKAGAEE